MPSPVRRIVATLRKVAFFAWLLDRSQRPRLGLRVLFSRIVSAFAPKSSLTWGAPTTGILLYERLKSGDPAYPGKIILHGQTPSPVPPNSMQELCRLGQNRHHPWPILWSRHQHAQLVSPTLGLVLPGKKIALESVYRKVGLGLDAQYQKAARSPQELREMTSKAYWIDEACSYVSLPPPVRLAGNYTSIVSHWTPTTRVPNFSHWFLDSLPRLAPLPEFPADTKILVPETITDYQKESLRLLGLLDRIRPTSETNLLVENYYFSAPASMVVCDSPYSVDFLRRSFLPKASKTYSGPKRFIIDREGDKRVIKNRAEVHRFFADLGWAIMKPETLSLADEIKLFADAEAIGGILGSGFTNALWCQPGCAVVQILPHNLLDGSTEWISMHNQLRWRYLVCPGDENLRAQVDLGELKTILRDLGLA